MKIVWKKDLKIIYKAKNNLSRFVTFSKDKVDIL